MAQLIRFTAFGDFVAYDQAKALLKRSGFSIGPTQRGAPTAAMYGDWAVSKWRNLRPAERTATHAIIEGDCRNGPVGISLLPACPADGRERFLEEAGEAVS